MASHPHPVLPVGGGMTPGQRRKRRAAQLPRSSQPLGGDQHQVVFGQMPSVSSNATKRKPRGGCGSSPSHRRGELSVDAMLGETVRCGWFVQPSGDAAANEVGA